MANIKNNMKVCSNCGYIGKGVKKGNSRVEFVLWLMMLIPGMIYTTWRHTGKCNICPECDYKNMIPTTAPEGRKLVAQYSDHEIEIEPKTKEASVWPLRIFSLCIMCFAISPKSGDYGMFQLSIFLIGLFFWPSITERLPKTILDHKLKFIFGILLLGSLSLNTSSHTPTQTVTAVATQESPPQEFIQRQNLFNQNREKIIESIKQELQDKEYSKAQHHANSYHDLKDPEILKLYSDATIRLKKATQLEKIETSLEALDGYKTKDFKNHTKDQIIVETLAFDIVSRIIQGTDGLDLNTEEQKKLQKLRTKLSQTQKIIFPRLRDAYGPALRKELWAQDMSAKTFGTKYRTLEIVGRLFVKNQNIAQFHATVMDTYVRLRFKNIHYKWYKNTDEYTSSDLRGDTPKDGDIAILLGRSKYQIVN